MNGAESPLTTGEKKQERGEVDRNHEGMEGGEVGLRGSRRTEPRGICPDYRLVVVVVEEESLALMTSHSVSLLVTAPRQITERLTEPPPKPSHAHGHVWRILRRNKSSIT